MLDPGQMLQNRYRIDALLGEGGMGAVYKAYDTRLKIPVALKEMVPQPGLDEHTLEQLHQQFEQEATVLAPLSHPHLVRVGDYFEEGDNTYLVMDFVEGESLINIIGEKGALPEAQVLTWSLQLLDALSYCHSRNVIHRDIKPQNVIITPEGKAVLVDFGLVKLWDPEDPQTKTVMRGVGTPEYAPPEQYSSQEGHTDPRSDLYGLAATMYHALTGEPPLGAAERMADPDQFIPVREMAPDVSQMTSIAVMKAMALARSQRWQDAKEMADALVEGEAAPLQPALEKPVIIEKPAVPARTRELPKEEEAPAKRGWMWVAAVAVIVVALAVGGWWLYQSGLLTGGTEAAQATQPITATEVPSAATSAPEATVNPTDVPQPTTAPTPHPSASDQARAFAQSILTGIGDRPPDYEDSFDDPGSGWTLLKTSDAEAGYQDGEYVITIASSDYSMYADSAALPTFADFALEVDGQFAAGDIGYWGTSWQWGDAQVTGVLIPLLAGPVQMVHCEGADCSSLGDIRNPALNPVGETNHLQIIAKGSEIAIAINGEWQVLATDLYYTADAGRRIRLEVLNSAASPLEVRWDNLKLWDITDLPAPAPTD
jgi:serine/threonine protein kinase